MQMRLLFVVGILLLLLGISGMRGRQEKSAADSATPASGSFPTFYRDVLPIVQQHCQRCHRAGEIAPMPLITYDSVQLYAPVIANTNFDVFLPASVMPVKRSRQKHLPYAASEHEAGALSMRAVPQFPPAWKFSACEPEHDRFER